MTELIQLIQKIEPAWISAIVALAALIFAITEYYFRIRPYLKIDIYWIENSGNYHFKGKVINFGNLPAHFKLRKEDLTIKIGDQELSFNNDIEAYAFPGDNPPSIDMGNINSVQVSKLLNNEYIDNNAHLTANINYCSHNSLFSRIFSYTFKFKYGIEFSTNNEGKVITTVFVIEQKF